MPVSIKLKIALIAICNGLLFGGSLVCWPYYIENRLYILSGVGMLALYVLLLGLGKIYHELRAVPALFWILVLIGIAESAVVFIRPFQEWDFYVVAVIILCEGWFWGAFCSAGDSIWNLFHWTTVKFTRIGAAFIMLFSMAYFAFVPLRMYALGATPVWDMVFDLVFASTMAVLGALMWRASRYRYVLLAAILFFVLWIMLPGDWLFRNSDRMIAPFPVAYYFLCAIGLIFGLIIGVNMGRWWGEALRLRRSHRSMVLGPWFANMFSFFKRTALTGEQRQSLKSGLKLGGFFLLLALPGLLTQLEVFRPAVTIVPGDTHVSFNFWAYPLVENYSADEIAAFNKHHVNLDIMLSVTPANIAELIEFETIMPNITYRVTVSQSEIAAMPARVQELTELMLVYEANGTLDQWRGYAFDIEGPAYNWYECYENADPVVGVWNQVFDYLDAKSLERGKTIETECVHSYEYAMDELFDGDMDLQIIEGQIAYNPKRFTLYAPMIYRCWPSGDLPYGSPKKPFDEGYRWGTSYAVYTRLTTMTAFIQPPQLGVYLGITNTSCYGRDMPQEEPISWGEPTGVDNLIRDTLIAKSFGIAEVTYFLQWTHTEPNGEVFGGLVDSYGADILDRIDAAVNVNSPESFQIYYDHSDAETSEAMSRDYMCNFNTFSWNYLMVLVWGAISIIELLRKSK